MDQVLAIRQLLEKRQRERWKDDYCHYGSRKYYMTQRIEKDCKEGVGDGSKKTKLRVVCLELAVNGIGCNTVGTH